MASFENDDDGGCAVVTILFSSSRVCFAIAADDSVLGCTVERERASERAKQELPRGFYWFVLGCFRVGPGHGQISNILFNFGSVNLCLEVS